MKEVILCYTWEFHHLTAFFPNSIQQFARKNVRPILQFNTRNTQFLAIQLMKGKWTFQRLLTESAVTPFLMYCENCFLKASSSSSLRERMYSATFWPKIWFLWTSAEKSLDSSSYPGKRFVLNDKMIKSLKGGR